MTTSETLELMCQHQQRHSPIFLANNSKIWTRVTRQFRTHLVGLDDIGTQTSKFNSKFSCYAQNHKIWPYYVAHMKKNLVIENIPKLPDEYHKACYMLFSWLKASDACHWLNIVRPNAKGMNNIMIENQLTSWDTLLALANLLPMFHARPELFTQPAFIIDLGAGWGRIMHAACQINPSLRCRIVDIPESLLVSQEVMKAADPKIRIRSWLDEADKENFSRDEILSENEQVGFWLPHQLNRCEDTSIDLLINVNSMSELRKDQIDTYYDIIDRKARLFCSINNNGKTYFSENYKLNELPIRQSWQKLIDHHESFYYPDYHELVFKMGSNA